MAAKKGLPTEIKFQLASATGKHFEADAREVYVETDDGDIGVLPGHQPEFYSIGAGFVTCKDVNGNEIRKLVYNGFVQIEPDVVRVGAQEIYEPGQVDLKGVERELSALREELSSLGEEEVERREEIEAEIKRKEALLRKAR